MDSLPAQLEGENLVPLLQGAPADVDAAAFTIYPRWQQYDTHAHCFKPYAQIEAIALSVRTQHYRLTDWVQWDKALGRPKVTEVIASELYDHVEDTGMGGQVFVDFERVNLAHDAAHATTLAQLRLLLHGQFSKWTPWGPSFPNATDVPAAQTPSP